MPDDIKLSDALKKIESQDLVSRPKVLVILGSAFSSIVDGLSVEKVIPFSEVLNLPIPSAPTHPGNFVFGKIAGCDVLLMQGRYHVYEGYPVDVTTLPVRLAAKLGIKKMVTTNLSGGINPAFRVGDLMVVRDHINLSGQTPLIWGQGKDSVFTDMFEAYNPALIRLLEESARKVRLRLRSGVLAYLTGPGFETRAELKMLKAVGADAVGWSLVPEVLEARRSGIEACAISCISDAANPDSLRAVDLNKLYQAGFECVPAVKKLLFDLIPKL